MSLYFIYVFLKICSFERAQRRGGGGWRWAEGEGEFKQTPLSAELEVGA